jgi:hypothetical protein
MAPARGERPEAGHECADHSPLRVRLAAALSLAIWISVAACGRLIAHF